LGARYTESFNSPEKEIVLEVTLGPEPSGREETCLALLRVNYFDYNIEDGISII